jgi:hypothetical protein
MQPRAAVCPLAIDANSRIKNFSNGLNFAWMKGRRRGGEASIERMLKDNAGNDGLGRWGAGVARREVPASHAVNRRALTVWPIWCRTSESPMSLSAEKSTTMEHYSSTMLLTSNFAYHTQRSTVTATTPITYAVACTFLMPARRVALPPQPTRSAQACQCRLSTFTNLFWFVSLLRAEEKIRGSFNKLLQTPLNTPYLLSGYNQIELVFTKQIALGTVSAYLAVCFPAGNARACRRALSTPRPPLLHHRPRHPQSH